MCDTTNDKDIALDIMKHFQLVKGETCSSVMSKENSYQKALPHVREDFS